MANRALAFALFAFVVAAVVAKEIPIAEPSLDGLEYVRSTLLQVQVPVKDATVVETDDEAKSCSQCPIGNTCCNLGGGWIGCCPISNAVCCPEVLGCCPPGYRCAGQYCQRHAYY